MIQPPLLLVPPRKRATTSACASQRGSVLVETALVLPMFFALLFGTMEIAIMLCEYCSANFACREAARYASVHSTTSENPATTAGIQAIVTENLIQFNSSTPTITVCYGTPTPCASASNAVGNMVGVGVSWSESVPWLTHGATTISLSAQSYRVVSR